jgi:predicted transcriptional regulator
MKQRLELGLYYLHVHFHSYASTLLIEMLKMINDGSRLTEIARALNIHKSHVSYYVRKAKEKGYLKEVIRDKIKFSRNHQYYDFQE